MATGVPCIELPDHLPPADPLPQEGGEERWLPLPGEVGKELEALARTALGDLVPPPPPEPSLDFNLLDGTDTPDTAEAAAGSVLLEGEELEDGSDGEDALSLPSVQGPAVPPAEASTAAEAVAQIGLPKAGHMEVACPNCSTAGLVPWDRLDAALCCSGCWTWFRIGGNGRKTVVDPPAASQGALRLYSRNGPDGAVQLKPDLLEEKRQSAKRRQRRGRGAALLGGLRIGPIVMALVPIAAIGVLVFLGVRWWSKPRLAKLPVELDQRARLLVESWLKYDTPVMVRMTHPNCRGTTRRWAYDHRPPLKPGQFDRRRAAIDVRILRQDENSAEAEVRVNLSGLSGSPEPIILRQRWECPNGTWLYKPSNEPVPNRLATFRGSVANDAAAKRR